MEDTLITFETAKLAKEKGFKIKGNQAGFTMNKPECLDFPTQSLLAKWLREEYNIYVTSQIGNLDFINTYHYDIRYIDKNKFICKVKGNFKTYEEALEAGLQEALKLI